MLCHSFKYMLLSQLRNKNQLFWCLAFPIVLGLLFNFAFSGLDSEEQFQAIPVAVVEEESQYAGEYIKMLIDYLGEEGENQLFSIVETGAEEQALEKLQQKEIVGILYVGDRLHLAVNAEDKAHSIEQSILNTFVEQFHVQYETVEGIVMTTPQKIPMILEEMGQEAHYLTDAASGLTDLSMKLSYFYNLLAMACLYAAMVGLTVTTNFQANLSIVGARKTVSSMNRFLGLVGELLAAVFINFCTLLLAFLVFRYGYGVNFGDQTGYTILAILVGSMTGVSLGFLVGCIGSFKTETKFAMLMAVTMSCCILSGLMVNDMRLTVEKICPVFNRINPAALISDTFFALAIYPSHTRYFGNLWTLLVISSICFIVGVILIRRKKYANI